MKFGLQHLINFDYRNLDTSQIVDSLKNLVTRAGNRGFDSFWVMDHFHQIPSDACNKGWVCRNRKKTEYLKGALQECG